MASGTVGPEKTFEQPCGDFFIRAVQIKMPLFAAFFGFLARSSALISKSPLKLEHLRFRRPRRNCAAKSLLRRLISAECSQSLFRDVCESASRGKDFFLSSRDPRGSGKGLSMSRRIAGVAEKTFF
jgi:hypothetical protein